MPPSTALATCTSVLEQVKSQTQSALYIGGNWVGDLTSMEPNQGYLIKVDGQANLIYPECSGGAISNLAKAIDPVASIWAPIKGTEHNMIVTGKVFKDGVELRPGEYYLVSHGEGGEQDCRSVGKIALGESSYYSTIVGDQEGEMIRFFVFDLNTQEMFRAAEALQFKPNELVKDFELHVSEKSKERYILSERTRNRRMEKK